MTGENCQVDYEELQRAAGEFHREAEALLSLKNGFRQKGEALVNCGWKGLAASAFEGELHQLAIPALDRLISALRESQERIQEISRIFSGAEEEAAGIFGKDESGGTNKAGGENPSKTPQYKIYLINGINWNGDDSTLQELKRNLEAQYGEGNVDVVIPDYHPYAYKPDGIMGGIGTAINIGRGVFAVASEMEQGGNGLETGKVYDWIKADMQKSFQPGQEVILIGHSGGGALVANLSEKINHDGYTVAGVATLGAPLSNFDLAASHSDKVVEITRSGDMIGSSYFRSSEIKNALVPGLISTLPLFFHGGALPIISEASAFLGLDQVFRDNYNVEQVTMNADNYNNFDAHFHYFSSDTAKIIREKFPLAGQL